MIHWKPALSVTAVIGGVFSAIGVLVLLQQAGTVYPTRNVTILTAVLGLVWGVAVPSLARLRRVRRANRKLAARSA